MIHTDGKRTIANHPYGGGLRKERKRPPLPDSMIINQACVTPAERKAMSRAIARRIVNEYR